MIKARRGVLERQSLEDNVKRILPPVKVAAAVVAAVQNGVSESTSVSEKTFTLPPSVDTVVPPRS